jgi:cardiolipin synthase
VPHLPIAHLGTVLGFVLAILLVARELRSRRAPSATIAWFLLIALAPYVGVPLYLIFGGRKVRQRAALKKPLYAGVPVHTSAESPIERLLDGMGVPAASKDNQLRLVVTGEEAFRTVLELIDGAKSRVHIATFILGGDETGNTIVDRLTARAREGLEVRLVIDGVFAFRANRKRLDELRKAGGRVAIFSPLIHVPFVARTDLRLHRKIVVVDGARAMVGGMNLAEEYMGPRPLPGRWRDVALRIEGSAAAALDGVFARDFAFASHQHDVEDDAPRAVPSQETNGAPLRVVPSGPDVATDALYDAILFALYTAKERIWIATPYFVPDEALAVALTLACRRGVDVTVVVPDPSNHLISDLAGSPYLRDIERAGGSIRPYRARMLHAKVIVIDHGLAMVGSANLDMRSLFLNYEVMALLYGAAEVDALAAWFTGVAAECAVKMREADAVRLAVEDVARLLGPLV